MNAERPTDRRGAWFDPLFHLEKGPAPRMLMTSWLDLLCRNLVNRSTGEPRIFAGGRLKPGSRMPRWYLFEPAPPLVPLERPVQGGGRGAWNPRQRLC